MKSRKDQDGMRMNSRKIKIKKESAGERFYKKLKRVDAENGDARNRVFTEQLLPGFAAIGGASGFFILVIILHIVQRGYDPVRQLMSELALGKYGLLMLPAFACFAISVSSVQVGLCPYGTSSVIRNLLRVSSLSLLGAGLFHLGNAPDIHICLVAVAFVLLVLTMYLLPRNVASFHGSVRITAVSWFHGLGTAVFAAAGQRLIPMGISQRGATACILSWLIWLGFVIIYNKIKKNAEPSS